MAFPQTVIQLLTGVGEQTISEGANGLVRADRLGGIVGSDNAGRYYEYARKGRLFHASLQAGAAWGTTLITTAAVTLTLANPAASQVNLSILAWTATPSAVEVTTALEGYYLGYYFSAAYPSATTNALMFNGLLTPNQGVAGGSPTGVAATAATVIAGKLIRVHPFSAVSFAAAGTTGYGISAVDQLDGAIVLAPNTAITLVGVGTTAISGVMSVTWAEIPI